MKDNISYYNYFLWNNSIWVKNGSIKARQSIGSKRRATSSYYLDYPRAIILWV